MTNEVKRNKTKTFSINDNWEIKRDVHGNHQPIRYREVKSKKTKLTSMKWTTLPNYFATLPAAVQFIIDTELFECLPLDTSVSKVLTMHKKIADSVVAGLLGVEL